MGSASDEFRRLMREWSREARILYGLALSAQALGRESAPLWAAWSVPIEAMLVGAWALGSSRILRAGKAQRALPMPEDGLPVDLLGYEAGSSKKVSDLFSARLPMTRQDWREVTEWARQRAQGMAAREATEALPDIMRRSPKVAALLTGQPAPGEQAFFVTGLDAQQAAKVKQLIADTLEGKKTVRTLRGELRAANVGDFVDSAQVETARNLGAARYETVLRTNMATAQTRGEDATLANPVVRAFVPLLQWSAVGDHQTRPTHEAMDGFVGTLEDLRRWGVTVPAGYSCRCSRIPVPVAQAMDRGWVNPDGTINRAAIDRWNGPRIRLLESGQFPDPGFVTA